MQEETIKTNEKDLGIMIAHYFLIDDKPLESFEVDTPLKKIVEKISKDTYVYPKEPRWMRVLIHEEQSGIEFRSLAYRVEPNLPGKIVFSWQDPHHSSLILCNVKTYSFFGRFLALSAWGKDRNVDPTIEVPYFMVFMDVTDGYTRA